MPFPPRLIRSAGALVWRPVGDAVGAPPGTPLEPSQLQVLLVHRPRYRDWSWPKGKAELNEPLPQAAVREVEEETGEVVILQAPLTLQRYRLGSGHTKEVHYWAARLAGSNSAKAARPLVVRASPKEIDITRWVKPGRARHLLTRRGDRRLLNELLDRAARGELDSSTVILLRHAKSRARDSWSRDEADRPLTRLGGSQALDLVPMLSAFGVDKIHTSSWLRCVQTVSPYAALTDVKMKTHDYLTEDGVAADPEESTKLSRKLLKKPKGSHLVSLHSPGLEPLLVPWKEHRGATKYPALDLPREGLRKAEMFVAHVAHPGGQDWDILDVERHGPYTRLRRH